MKLESLSDLGNVHLPVLLAGAVPVLLLIGFVVLAAWGKKMNGGGWLAIGLHGLTAAMGMAVFAYMHLEQPRALRYQLMVEWFQIGGKPIDMGIWVDAQSSLMLALVTGITFLVHLFSLAYMAHDEMRHRYWAYLSLFAAAMCGLVLADNLLLMFVFWELVGLASYLLIGFWIKKKKPAMASQKAFIVNRIADAGFIMALMLVWRYYGNFGWATLTQHPHDFAGFMIGLCLIIGAIGKSAQFPFQVWLPDAMAGPTPVSSLIHAATMVVAGVYLLLRIEPFLDPALLTGLAWLGAMTALLAACSALSQTDIKRVLAYSTISQLGFMVMGIGVGVPEYSFFHLITHAFFKCGLFLVAATVIHHQHAAQAKTKSHFDVQDMRFMGGLGKSMPLVAVCWLIFAASLSGLPLFSGFLSKDGILLGAISFAQQRGGVAAIVPLSAILTSLLTAFYIARQGILVFVGKNRAKGAGATEDFFPALPRVNWRMALPLALLAFASTWVIFSPIDPFHGERFTHAAHPTDPSLPWIFAAIALFGMVLAVYFYYKGPLPNRSLGWVFDLSFKHFYLDDIYRRLLVKPLMALGRMLTWIDHRVIDGMVRLVAGTILRRGHRPSLSEASEWLDHHLIDPVANEVIQPTDRHSLSRASAWLDQNLVDRLVNGLATMVMRSGKRASKLQSGKLQLYILYTLLTILVLLLAMIYIFTA